MSLTWQSNFGHTEFRIFRGKVIAGLLRTSLWKDDGYGELDGYMLRFRTTGFWKRKTELLDIEGSQVLGTIEYNVMRSRASITYGGETYYWKYASWTKRSWSVEFADGSAVFNSIGFWGNKGEIVTEQIAGAVVLSALFVHRHFARMTAAVT
jgi:hypothetical protein